MDRKPGVDISDAILDHGTYSILIDRTMDNTALDAYMTCPRKYFYGYVEHRRKDSLTPALSYGTCWHAGMEAHYATMGDRELVYLAMLRAWKPHNRPDDYRTLDRCMKEYDRYVQNYGPPEKERGQTVRMNNQAMLEMAAEGTWPGCPHPYVAKIDRLIELEGQVYVEDHKTASQFRSDYFRQFELSNQMMGYAWVAERIIGRPVAGVRINAHFVYKAQAGRFERYICSYSRDRLAEWPANYERWIRRIERSRSDNDWPMNLNACAGKYGMCAYADVCVSSPRVRDSILSQDFDEAPWDPLRVVDEDSGQP